MSDVQPMIYVEDLERAMAFYREQLGFELFVFGNHKQAGAPLIAEAKLEEAVLLLTNEELFRDGGGTGSGSVRLYFHIEEPVDVVYERIVSQPDVRIVEGPTDQHWSDRTLMIRDPWGVLLVFSNRSSAG